MCVCGGVVVVVVVVINLDCDRQRRAGEKAEQQGIRDGRTVDRRGWTEKAWKRGGCRVDTDRGRCVGGVTEDGCGGVGVRGGGWGGGRGHYFISSPDYFHVPFLSKRLGRINQK